MAETPIIDNIRQIIETARAKGTVDKCYVTPSVYEQLEVEMKLVCTIPGPPPAAMMIAGVEIRKAD